MVIQMRGLKSKYTTIQVLHRPSPVRQSENSNIFHNSEDRTKTTVFHKNSTGKARFLSCMNNV